MSARCPRCGEPVGDDDQFCESCGAELATAAAVPATEERPTTDADAASAAATADRRCTCGGAIDADGFCTVCGLRAPTERDHFSEQPASNVAAVCDRGRVHHRNEDAVALGAVDGRLVIVVCDGVTSATDSDVAALAATHAARDALVAAPDAPADPPAARAGHWTARLVDACAAAQAAAANGARRLGATTNPPSCTFVATVVDGALLTTGWVGDSRAYWFADDGSSKQLSVDDSWATEQTAHGMTRAVAEADPRSHSITRWLGVDSPDPTPTCASATVAGPGWLLVCTDGLWNYCSEPAELATLLRRCVERSGADPLALATALVEWANEQGGHDNVTVALARVEPSVPGAGTAVPVAGAAATDVSTSTAPTRPPAPEPT